MSGIHEQLKWDPLKGRMKSSRIMQFVDFVFLEFLKSVPAIYFSVWHKIKNSDKCFFFFFFFSSTRHISVFYPPYGPFLKKESIIKKIRKPKNNNNKKKTLALFLRQ